MASRVGSFTLGFATGALTVVALRRLQECRKEMSYESLADSIQFRLQELESRIGAPAESKPRSSKRIKK